MRQRAERCQRQKKALQCCSPYWSSVPSLFAFQPMRMRGNGSEGAERGKEKAVESVSWWGARGEGKGEKRKSAARGGRERGGARKERESHLVLSLISRARAVVILAAHARGSRQERRTELERRTLERAMAGRRGGKRKRTQKVSSFDDCGLFSLSSFLAPHFNITQKPSQLLSLSVFLRCSSATMRRAAVDYAAPAPARILCIAIASPPRGLEQQRQTPEEPAWRWHPPSSPSSSFADSTTLRPPRSSSTSPLHQRHHHRSPSPGTSSTTQP